MFGALNAFISGLAFIGFLVALQLQRKELKLQREEMERSRVESEKQTKVYESQNNLISVQLEMARVQSIHQEFWNLYSLLEKNYSDFDIKQKGNVFMRSLLVLRRQFLRQQKAVNYLFVNIEEEYRKFIDAYYDLKSLFIKSISLIEVLSVDPNINWKDVNDGRGSKKGDTVQYMSKIISSLGSKSTKQAMGYFIYLFNHEEYANQDILDLFFKHTNIQKEESIHQIMTNKFITDIKRHNSVQDENDPDAEALLDKFVQIIKDGKTSSILK